MNNNILIIDKLDASYAELLQSIGYQFDYQPSISRLEIIGLAKQYVGLIVRSKTVINEELLAGQKELKFIARAGAGIDQLDVSYLKRRNIDILNAPEGNRDALGEHVLGMLLNLSNNLRKGDQEIRNSIWDREGNRGFEISGKTIGLLGYGFMGSAVAEKLAGFGCRVIAHDKHRVNYGDLYAEEVSMEDVFEQSDVFSIHVPLTEETQGLVNLSYLKKFKKAIVFVNAARGEITSLADLNTAMDQGIVKCAALDVLENEKLNTLNAYQKESFDSLVKRDNVLLSPHVGGWSVESYRKINEILVKKISEGEYLSI